MLTLPPKMKLRELIQWLGYEGPVSTYNIWKKRKPAWNLPPLNSTVDTKLWLEVFSGCLLEIESKVSKAARIKIAAELAAPAAERPSGETQDGNVQNSVTDAPPQPAPPTKTNVNVTTPPEPVEILDEENGQIPTSGAADVIFDDSPMEIFMGQAVGEGADLRQQIRVNDWTLTRYGEEVEPRISDLELASHLGYAHPRHIRKLIRRMIAESRMPGTCDVRSTVERTSMPNGGIRQVEESGYYLTYDQALMISTQSTTPRANEITQDMVRVYSAFRKGLLRTLPQPTRQQGMITIEEVGGLITTTIEAVTKTMLPQLMASLGELLDKRAAATPTHQPATPPPPPQPPPLQPRAPVVRLDSRRPPEQPSLFPQKWNWLRDVIAATGLPPIEVRNIAYDLGLYRRSPPHPYMRKVPSPSGNGESWQYSNEAIRIILECLPKPSSK